MQKQRKHEVKTSMRVAFENIEIPLKREVIDGATVTSIMKSMDSGTGIKRKGKLWRVIRRGKPRKRVPSSRAMPKLPL